MDIVCLGEVLIDMFPSQLGVRLVEVPAFHPKPGGAPANVAVAAARLGARSAFIGKVGDDAFGHYLVSILAAEGVDTRGMRYDRQARTTMAFIAKPDPDTNEYVFYRNPGADTLLDASELDRGLLEGTRVLHFGSLSLTHEHSRNATLEAVKLAHAAGRLVSFDVNYRPSLWNDGDQARGRIMETIPLADVVKVNETELELITGTADLKSGSAALLAMGPSLCVATLGPNGSYFRSALGGAAVPGFAVKTVDATGCGDAFVAGLLTQLVAAGAGQASGSRPALSPDILGPANLSRILRYANAVGALTAQKLGVIPSLPAAAAVDAFVAQRS
jgi:fructokinase